MYCAKDIPISLVEKEKIEPKSNNTVSKFLDLAQMAMDGENYHEAYDLYLRIIEDNPTHSKAWIGKGLAAGWLSTVNKIRLKETIICFDKALGTDDTKTTKKFLSNSLLELSSAIYVHVNKIACDNTTSPFGTNLYWNTHDLQDLNEEMKELIVNTASLTINALVYAWELHPHIDIAYAIWSISNNAVRFQGMHKYPEVVATFTSINQEYVEKGRELDKDQWNKLIQESVQQIEPAKSCCIATATMGDINHPYIMLLRQYRDNILLNRALGRLLVRIYYLASPPLAKLIEKSPVSQRISQKLIIKPLVELMQSKYKLDL